MMAQGIQPEDRNEEVLDDVVESSKGDSPESTRRAKVVTKQPTFIEDEGDVVTSASKTPKHVKEKNKQGYEKRAVFLEDEGDVLTSAPKLSPNMEGGYERRLEDHSESTVRDSEITGRIQENIRRRLQRSSAEALKKPVFISAADALGKAGAKILQEKYGTPSKKNDMLVETISGPMVVVSGIQKPQALSATFGDKLIFAASSPGLKYGPDNELEKNQIGFVIKSDNKAGVLSIFMAKSSARGPYLGDQGAALVNGGIVEAGSLLHAEENIHPNTVLGLMNDSINNLKAEMKVSNPLVSLMGAELDISDEIAHLRVTSAGNLQCLIINPETGMTISPPDQSIDTKLRQKHIRPKTREAILEHLAEESPQQAAAALITAGGVDDSAFKPEVRDYRVPKGFVVLFTIPEVIQSLGGSSHNKQAAIGQKVRDEFKKGVPIDKICAELIRSYRQKQASLEAPDTSFGLIGLQIPGQRKAKATLQNKESDPAPYLNLDLTDL